MADFGAPVEFHRIRFPAPAHLAQCNPSLAYDDARRRFRVVVRAVNDLADLDERLELRRVQSLSDDHDRRPPPPASFPVTGIEDLRLSRFRSQW